MESRVVVGEQGGRGWRAWGIVGGEQGDGGWKTDDSATTKQTEWPLPLSENKAERNIGLSSANLLRNPLAPHASQWFLLSITQFSHYQRGLAVRLVCT